MQGHYCLRGSIHLFGDALPNHLLRLQIPQFKDLFDSGILLLENIHNVIFALFKIRPFMHKVLNGLIVFNSLLNF